MTQASELLVVGKVGAPYGVKGWVKIHSYTEIAENIFSYQPWTVDQGDEQKTLHIEQWRAQPKGLVAKLANVDDRDAAELLKNLTIQVSAEQLPALAEDEFYWRDLIGMQVVNLDGYQMGTVDDLFETGANDVMLVKARRGDAFGQKQRMIPFLLDQVIVAVDHPNNTIKVDWDPGF